MSDTDIEKPQGGRVVRFANPGPLGFISYASTLMIYSLYNVHARHINVPNAIVGQAVAVGGLGQVLAGIGEYFNGNLILIPDSGVLAAYAASPEASVQLNDALGIWLITWFIITFVLFLASLRSSVASASVFFTLFTTFILLAAGNFTEHVGSIKAGGWVGLVSASTAFYVGSAQLFTPHQTYFRLPVMELPKFN
ncbi:hypothetical protein FRB99_002810 [Tulasnella sp. 403]|nr:hypothetical protein FRB99_002810 [Tulasnella sp. 403]